MKWFVIVSVLVLVLRPTFAVHEIFLDADGNEADSFNEGDTVICRCHASYEDAPFTSAKFEWRRHGSTDRIQITDGEQIVLQDRNRFSAVNLTDSDTKDNYMDYQFTISNVDRYDNGFRFYCQFIYADGSSTGAGGVAGKMVVNWNPPSAQCPDVPDMVKDGDAVSYRCSTVDVDVNSNGSISLWKNGQIVETAAETSPGTPMGTQYDITYATPPATEDIVKDVYTCRYNGTGGFEEYNSNCTFNMPSCIVDDLADSCDSGSVSDAVSARGNLQNMSIVGISMLIMFWIQG